MIILRYNCDNEDLESVAATFTSIRKALSKEEEIHYAPYITEITDKYLGKGKKIANITRDQTEQLSLIVFDLKELFKVCNYEEISITNLKIDNFEGECIILSKGGENVNFKNVNSKIKNENYVIYTKDDFKIDWI